MSEKSQHIDATRVMEFFNKKREELRKSLGHPKDFGAGRVQLIFSNETPSDSLRRKAKVSTIKYRRL